MAKRRFRCSECGHTWEVDYGAPRPSFCPQCKSSNLHRAEEDRGYARRGSRVRGRGGFGDPPVGKEG
jgi:transposase-like protein